MVIKGNINKSCSIFADKEKFLKEVFFSSTKLISNKCFISEGLKNRNLMFFINCVIDSISSISMLGSRNLNYSLIGKIDNLIEYYNGIIDLYDKPKMSKFKVEYIIKSIKNNVIINPIEKKRYLSFVSLNNDQETIENLKLIKISLLDNKYFDTTSSILKEILISNDISSFDKIFEVTNEFIALLLDYIGVSIYEIKRVIKDTFRLFFDTHNEVVFFDMLDKLTNDYKCNNGYTIYIKMDKDFDEKLITSLKQSQNDNYIIYSKSGFEKSLTNDESIRNKRNLNAIINKYVTLCGDNKYFISDRIHAKDIWYAIREFRQKTIQPFIGTMLYSGINVNTSSDYIVVVEENEKKFINEYKYFDDVYKPLSQDRIDYSDVFKRYIIESSNNDINKIIDEAVQLLPYYKNSDSILIKFTNTWFALETLFRNSSESIINGLTENASFLVADRMLSGYIYVTSIQIKKLYVKCERLSNNSVINTFMNYDNNFDKDLCDYLKWKYEKIKSIINDYEKYFDCKHEEARELLDNAYRLRNKQFHGTKDSKLENMSGLLYDIVNDTISFYIDYLDVYKDYRPNSKALFNIIKNIKNIKNNLLINEENIYEKIAILYDSVRKI